ncbi:MAG: hypothetical protein H6745_18260 [Deltaproteobacteria bacterium]|nr:hypothetical protein [Deltaproteobacteria bacterium]
MKVALVSSIGGHLAELLELAAAFGDDHELVWILNDRSPVLPEGARAYVISHAERDWRVAWNLVELAAIFSRERPDVVVSTGAGPAVPAALVGRLAGVPYIHVEPSSAVRDLTLTGRLVRHLTKRFYVQWESLRAKAPGARFVGGLL